MAEDVLDAVEGFDLVGLATMILDPGVKAVFVSVPVGLIVNGAEVGTTVGVGSGEVTLAAGAGLKAGVFDCVTGGGLAEAEKLGVWETGGCDTEAEPGGGEKLAETDTEALPVLIGGWLALCEKETVPLPVVMGG